MPLQTPWVDVRSVGAGGGSIASADRGLLNVGPRSAGAHPGPVCYGRGGTEPTVTDAAVTLGMLARDTLASGLKLDVVAAAAALARLGEELGLEPEQAARGVMRVAGATMAGAIRAVSIEVGEDPRSAALIAYGGAGPLFASLLARELGIRTIVIPNYAGNFSAWGLLEQDVVRSAALTIVSPLDEGGLARAQQTIEHLFEQLDSRARPALEGTTTQEAEFDLRYPGQEYTLTVSVALADGRIAEAPEPIADRFAELYERTYGHSFDVGIDILSVRASRANGSPASGASSSFDPQRSGRGTPHRACLLVRGGRLGRVRAHRARVAGARNAVRRAGHRDGGDGDLVHRRWVQRLGARLRRAHPHRYARVTDAVSRRASGQASVAWSSCWAGSGRRRPASSLRSPTRRGPTTGSTRRRQPRCQLRAA